MAGTTLFERRLNNKFWGYITLAIVLLGLLGWRIHDQLERSLNERLEEAIEVILHGNVRALENWLDGKLHFVSVVSDRPTLLPDFKQLLEQPNSTNLALKHKLLEISTPFEFEAFALIAPNGTVVFASDNITNNARVAAPLQYNIDRALTNGPLVTPPLQLNILKQPQPALVAMAALPDKSGVLLFTLDAHKTFSNIIGERYDQQNAMTYAFDKNGMIVNDIGHVDQLRTIGLLNSEQSSSILNVSIKDPEVNLLLGAKADRSRDAQAQTLMLSRAMETGDGTDILGYRDFRGVPVIGSWTWFENYQLGLVTEFERRAAYAPLNIISRIFVSIFALIILSVIIIIVYIRVKSLTDRRAEQAEELVKELGQYHLEYRIGAGGMGAVYRATHKMLKRPTAIKLMLDDKDPENIARFEREVQLTCSLSHPNTIAIYDYGKTNEGIFYYAMEMLDGCDLDTVLEHYGPQPANRVIHILRQAAGSLHEAHQAGLIHRDIKPANIFLSKRGGLFDVVKVLDFGLVKQLKQTGAQVTAANVIAGTPDFMCPEIIKQADHIDGRSDLYSLACVAYELLCGHSLFDEPNTMALLMHHCEETPVPPSQRASVAIPQDLENLIMSCLAKDPNDRPVDMQAFIDALDNCKDAFSWRQVDARSWWTHDNAASATNKKPESLGQVAPSMVIEFDD